MAWKESTGYRCLAWLALVVGGLFLAWVTGRLQPHLVPDTASYLDYPFDSLEQACRSIRTPGYPIWLRMINRTWGIGLVPACQVVVHATAVFLFVIELQHWSMSRPQRIVVAIALAVGCTPTDHISTISSDSLAASLGIVTAALLLRWARLNGMIRSAAMVAAVAFATIMVRPAYLFLIPWLFVAGWMLRRLRVTSRGTATTSSLILATLAFVPVVGWMVLRHQVVDDFGMLPFGHQNLAGILVQLVSDDELQVIKGKAGELAKEIVEEKSRLAQTGHRFAEGEPGATMTIDARWDDMTYFVVVAAAKRLVGDDPIAQHGSVSDLNHAIIRQWPQRYAMWLLKSVRRGAWAIAADIVMHPVFLLAIVLAMAHALYRNVTESFDAIVIVPQPSLAALAIVAITFLVMKVGFVILTSPPIGRFSDAAAIFLPAWLAAAFIHRFAEGKNQINRPPSISMT